MRFPRSLCASVFVLVAACGTTSQLIEDNLSNPEAITAIGLGTVRFDYERWANKDPKDVATAKEHEAEWAKALGDAFLARITKRGLGGSPADRTVVDITIVDLDPGSRAARYWLGFGAGTGLVSVVAATPAHGSFRMNGKIKGGAWGGNFRRVMEELGEDMAEHFVDRRKK